MVTVALEATLHWHWLERQLNALGHRVVVAHPYQVELILQARAKTDPIDARELPRVSLFLMPALGVCANAPRVATSGLAGSSAHHNCPLLS
jgi:hypothetical protein